MGGLPSYDLDDEDEIVENITVHIHSQSQPVELKVSKSLNVCDIIGQWICSKSKHNS